ncbi:hypothetical protein SAMN05444405_11345 [Bacteroides luti]|uniref:Clostripain n=1 Tax=Bacteroides luti TaxID=1297750 RepID=A0A1M5E829_9BACE|nr:clostripain-related cysteine peptidase [Bacteroides luti]SHF75340.1 hypothetical protein SAMN05444405_11345 [Bacteroides luti]
MKKLFLLLLGIIVFSACHHDDDPTPSAINNRTVLVYMVADNNLTSNVEANIDSMMSGYKTAEVTGNLLIYLDDSGKTPVIYKLKKSSNGTVTKETVKSYSEQNSLDVSVMKSVLSDVYTSYPADSYGLVLWSHGKSWVPSQYETISTKWFGQDQSTTTQGDETNYMDIPDLADALSGAPHLDFIMFDACNMSCVEVAYELKDHTDYLIASPTEVISDGFPYAQIIEPMFSINKNYQKIASSFYDYYNAMSGEYKSATIAMTKCSEMNNLATATNKIIGAHASVVSTFVSSGIQLYDRENSVNNHFAYDFGHFIESIATPSEWTAFQKQLDATVVYKKTTDYFINLKIDSNHFSGIGAYIPKAAQPKIYSSFFKSLSWYNAAGWNQVSWYWE